MKVSLTSPIGTPAFCASWARARFSSRRTMAVNRSFGRRFAWDAAIITLVLQGLPTTATRQSSAATASIDLPWATKILPLSFRRSARSMPGPRGLEPTRSAQFTSLKATSASPVRTMLCSRGKAQSSSSMATPFSAFCGPSTGISRSCRISGWSAPNIWPEARRNRSA